MSRDLTPNFSKPSLCARCGHSLIRKGEAKSSTIVYCNAMGSFSHPLQVSGKVIECNRFYDKAATPLHEMKETAWILLPDRKTVGFAPPAVVREHDKERHKIDLPGSPGYEEE